MVDCLDCDSKDCIQAGKDIDSAVGPFPDCEKQSEKSKALFKEGLLARLVKNDELVDAPWKTKRHGKWYEFLVGIGNDETASIYMTEEGYNALMGICPECGKNG